MPVKAIVSMILAKWDQFFIFNWIEFFFKVASIKEEGQIFF